MTTADRPALRCRQSRRPVPYVLTDLGRAALEAWPANRVEHEPHSRCDGHSCRCTFPPSGGAR